MSKTLLVDLSAHGFGHLAQTAEILNQLPKDFGRILVRTSLPADIVQARVNHIVECIEADNGQGMLMHLGLEVDRAESHAWYRHFHSQWDKHVEAEQHKLRSINPDLLLTNIAYTGLAAAAQLSIPSVAVCSLNWADVYRAYCSDFPEADHVFQQIQDAYHQADVFLTPEPSMPMSLRNCEAINPIVKHGGKSCDVLPEHRSKKKVLVSLGGLPTGYNADMLPLMHNVVWIVPNYFDESRDDVVCQAAVQAPYIDLLASVDLVFTKTGYGTLIESVAHKKPVICIKRPGWPEEDNLFAWSQLHGYFKALSMENCRPDFLEALVNEMLNVAWEKPVPSMNGAMQVAQKIIRY